MKASELREKSKVALEKELNKLLEEQFFLSTKKATGQLSQTHLLKSNQRNIARIKTILNEPQKA